MTRHQTDKSLRMLQAEGPQLSVTIKASSEARQTRWLFLSTAGLLRIDTGRGGWLQNTTNEFDLKVKGTAT